MHKMNHVLTTLCSKNKTSKTWFSHKKRRLGSIRYEASDEAVSSSLLKGTKPRRGRIAFSRNLALFTLKQVCLCSAISMQLKKVCLYFCQCKTTTVVIPNHAVRRLTPVRYTCRSILYIFVPLLSFLAPGVVGTKGWKYQEIPRRTITTVARRLLSARNSLQHRWAQQCSTITCSQWWPSREYHHGPYGSGVCLGPLRLARRTPEVRSNPSWERLIQPLPVWPIPSPVLYIINL